MVDVLKSMITGSDRIVGFTGAGISTDSGIPDYRSQGGIWDRFQPVYFQEFLTDEAKRRLYWERKWELWPTLQQAQPTAGHVFFKNLLEEGRLAGVVTQNIDGLHEQSGLPSSLVVKLHGNALETVCLDCGHTVRSSWIYDNWNLDDGVPVCGECGGLYKPNTISFGQSLDPGTIARAERMVRDCDLLIAMGSTLIVYPAASFPAAAKESGAKLVIITLSDTPLDGMADLVINRPIAEVLDEYNSLGG